MIWFEHILFSILFILPLYIIFQNNISFYIFLLGVTIGSLVPDVDEPKSLISKIRLRKASSDVESIIVMVILILRTITHLIYKFTSFFAGGYHHRGLTHTILFSTILFLVVLILTLILKHFLSINLDTFAIGFYIGLLLHIYADSFTVTGVRPFYPFYKVKIRGKLKTNINSFVPVIILFILITIEFMLLKIMEIINTFPLFIPVNAVILELLLR